MKLDSDCLKSSIGHDIHHYLVNLEIIDTSEDFKRETHMRPNIAMQARTRKKIN